MDRKEIVKKAVDSYIKIKNVDVSKKICPLMSWHQPTIIYCVDSDCALWNLKKFRCSLIRN